MRNGLDGRPKRALIEAREYLTRIVYVETQREYERLRDVFKDYPTVTHNAVRLGAGGYPLGLSERALGSSLRAIWLRTHAAKRVKK